MANVVDLFSARTGTAFPNTESGSRSKGFLKFLGWPFSIVFAMLADVSAVLGSLDIVFGEVDR